MNDENAAELFQACSRKSCEQVEVLLAARFPRPDVPDSIRRLPVRSAGTPDGEPGTTRQPAQVAPIKAAIPPKQRVEPLSVDRFGVHFTADAEFCELLEQVRALASHRESGGDLTSLMKRGLEAYRRELQKERFGVGTKPRRCGARRFLELDHVRPWSVGAR